jgi:asparagine synthase (glutamine-hydrolysing)
MSKFRYLLKYGLWPLLPIRLRELMRGIMRKPSLPPWILPEFARRISLRDRIYQEETDGTFARFAQAQVFNSSTNGWQVHCTEVEGRADARFALDRWHPLYDRRIVEFLLAIPEEQRCGDLQKHVLRQAMRDILPESIRLRQTKAEFSHVFSRAYEAQVPLETFDSLAIADVRWVSGEAPGRMYRDLRARTRNGAWGYHRANWPLWMIYGVETWFRNEFSRGTESRKKHLK